MERGVNMTWREGANQAGFSIVGLHKIHHDDIPQVLTEKLAQELRECGLSTDNVCRALKNANFFQDNFARKGMNYLEFTYRF